MCLAPSTRISSTRKSALCWCWSHILLIHWGAAVVIDNWLPAQCCLEQVVSQGLLGPWHSPPVSKKGYWGSGNPQQLPSPWTSLKLWLQHRDSLGVHGCGVHGRSTLNPEGPWQGMSTSYCAHYTSRLSCQDAAFSPGTSCCRYIRQSTSSIFPTHVAPSISWYVVTFSPEAPAISCSMGSFPMVSSTRALRAWWNDSFVVELPWLSCGRRTCFLLQVHSAGKHKSPLVPTRR